MSDEIERRPAGENPWYVLMTIAGEQGDIFDEALHRRNRRFWHGWIGPDVDAAVRDAHCERAGIYAGEFAPFTQEERAEWEAVVATRISGEVPQAEKEIVLRKVLFETRFAANGFLFSLPTTFEDAKFVDNAHFGSVSFLYQAVFKGSKFCVHADFRAAEFQKYAVFKSAKFAAHANFQNASFEEFAEFKLAEFGDFVTYQDATFSSLAEFVRAKFPENAHFVNATFSVFADFQKVRFEKIANFQQSTFSSGADFVAAFFGAEAQFHNAKFASSTNFLDAKFDLSPPKLYGATLHEDTTWPDAHLWPSVPTEGGEADVHRQAYDKLREIMEDRKRFEEEQFFLIKGFQCKEVKDGRLSSMVSKAYGFVSRYGTSMGRPAVGLLGVVVGGWLLMGLGFLFRGSCPAGMVGGTGAGCMWSSLQVSLANTFPFLGAGRSILRDEIEALIAFDWYEWLAMSQTVLGPVCLFFLLMGMRNRFRMR